MRLLGLHVVTSTVMLRSLGTAAHGVILHAPLGSHLVEVVMKSTRLQLRLLNQRLSSLRVWILRQDAAAVHEVLSLAALLKLSLEQLRLVQWLKRRLCNLFKSDTIKS